MLTQHIRESLQMWPLAHFVSTVRYQVGKSVTFLVIRNYNDRYTYVYKHAARLYQPSRNHYLLLIYKVQILAGSQCLFSQIYYLFEAIFCHTFPLVTTWSQPCTNHATTLFQSYNHLVAMLLQGWYKLATMLSTHGWNGCTTLWQGCHNLVFSIYGNVWQKMASNK